MKNKTKAAFLRECVVGWARCFAWRHKTKLRIPLHPNGCVADEMKYLTELARTTHYENFADRMAYVKLFSVELQVYYVKAALKANPICSTTKGFVDWAIEIGREL